VSDHTFARKGASSSGRRGVSKQKILGKFYDQRFYATRLVPGKAFHPPFAPHPFNVMIHIAGHVPDKALRQIGLDLLKHGMRFALCHGSEAERMGDILDELLEDNEFAHKGYTAYTSVHDDDPLEEAVEYFILPSGLADTGLMLVIGDESSFRSVMRAFTKVTGHLRERIFVSAAQ
jgi:hypothetical protein